MAKAKRRVAPSLFAHTGTGGLAEAGWFDLGTIAEDGIVYVKPHDDDENLT